MMPAITDPKINDYLMKLSLEDDPLVLEMERLAKENDFPIVDRLVGRLIYLLTKLKDPKLVVELGSGYGYSAYWFAKALGRGKVILTDNEEDNIAYAKEIFGKAGLSGKASFHAGDAVSIASAYRDIDILFIDIDKHQYPRAIKRLLPNLAKNALVIADNTLWYGKVTGKNRDRDTLGIKKFNEFMFGNADFFSTIVPLRDGVLIAYRTG
ncbi:MAG: O-methyltransferase [Nitrospiraceae bacterium]|nr:O-methyltransferase [Nitrospiraceae bacterium]